MSTLSLPIINVKASAVLGAFSKAVDGGCSLNYCRSGGANCDQSCSHYRVNCYADRTENRFDRVELLAKLMRHENTDAAELTMRARYEIAGRLSKGIRVPWFRFSTNGSVPQAPSRRFADELRALLAYLHVNSIPVHFPVETSRKARVYRRLVRGLAVIRESCHSEARFIGAAGAVSFTGGNADQSRLERVTESKRLARARTERTGRKCIVCPAVASRYLHKNVPSETAKCGNCTACANPYVDIVYPLH